MSGYDRVADSIPLARVPSHRSNGYTSQKDSITPLRSKEGMTRGDPGVTRQLGHRMRTDGSRGNIGYDGEQNSLNSMGRIYRRILNFNIVTRYTFYVLPIGALLAVPIVVGAVISPHPVLAGIVLYWFFAWIEIVWLGLWVAKLFAHFLPTIFQILIGVVSSGTRKYALILKAIEIPISILLWAIIALSTFKPLMYHGAVARADLYWANDVVFNLLLASVFSAVVFLAEKFFIQLISINYHRKQFVYRITDNKRIVSRISELYEASRKMFPMYGKEFAEEDYIIADQLDLHKAFGAGRTATGRKRAARVRVLQNFGRIGDKVTSMFGNVAKEVTGKEVFNPNSAHSIVIEALEKKASSEALARRLWMSFVIEDSEALYQSDLIEVLGEERRTAAEEAFAALDRDGNGDISLDEMIMAIVEIGRERKAIASSMHDVDQAITVLDRLLLSAVFIAIILIFIAFLNKNLVTTLATTGTALLSLSFVFATTAQEVLGSCIFLFVKHPFDIGDRVDIAKDQLTVDHISLLFTVFRRVSGDNVGRLVQIPNIVLNTLWIENVSRSQAMKEQITLAIHYDTSFEDIQLLRNELLEFVRDKDNSRDFKPDLEVEVLGTSDLTKLELRVEIQHKTNWSNETLRAARRSKFMCALVAALRRVPIYNPGGGAEPLGSAANASYSVAIAADVAASNKEKLAKDKNAARLQPKGANQKEDEPPLLTKRSTSRTGGSNSLGLTNAQANAIDAINSRDPLKDTVRDTALATGREDGRIQGLRSSLEHRDAASATGSIRRVTSTTGRRKANSIELARSATGSNAHHHPYGFDPNHPISPGSDDFYGENNEYRRGSEERWRYEQAQRAAQQQGQQLFPQQQARPALSTVPSAGSIGTISAGPPAPPYNGTVPPPPAAQGPSQNVAGGVYRPSGLGQEQRKPGVGPYEEV